MDYDTKMRMIKQWFAEYFSFEANYGVDYYNPNNPFDDKVDITPFDVLYTQINESEAHECEPRYFKYGTFIYDMLQDDERDGADVIVIIFDETDTVEPISVGVMKEIRRELDGGACMPIWNNVFYVKHNHH